MKIPVKNKGGAFVIEAHFVNRGFCGAGVNARGAGSCDQAVRPRHVRGVGDGDEEQKAEERVGEHDVEMQGGPEEEIIEMGRNDDEQEDHEMGRCKFTKLHDPKLPSEMGVKEHYCSGHMPYRSWCHHCVRGRGRERDHERKGDFPSNFPSTTWTIASLAMSSTG